MIPQLIFAVLLGADLTGVWSGDIMPSISLTLTLDQTGDSVSGTEKIADRVFSIENARVDDDKLTFTLPIPGAGRLHHMPVAATLQNGELHLRDSGPEIVLKRVQPNPEAARVERLAAVIRLWGAIRFFHPWVAYKPIDWDAALISAIQPAEKAATRDELIRAIANMLSRLGDSETRVLTPDEQLPVPLACDCRRITRSGYFEGAPSASAPYYVEWENVGARASYTMALSEGIRVAIRTAEPVGGGTDIRAADIRTKDDRYPGDLPAREFRLLALARYWNTIHYFYGYPDLLEAWDSALAEFIPQFEQAETRRDYLFAISRLASRTHDGHSITTLNGVFGMSPTANLQNLGGQIVVTATGAPELHTGDVITRVDGEPAGDRERFLANLFPHATPWFGMRLADRYLLAGSEPNVKVGVRRTGGKEEEIEVNRVGPVAAIRPAPITPGAFGRLPSGLGYIDLTRLAGAEVDPAFDSLMDAPGLILDLRGYPNGTFTQVAARLTDRPVAAALIRLRVWHGPDPAAITQTVTVQTAYPNGKPVYRGPVAVLIDSRAFSQSEHMCLYLEAVTRVVFVGTPTAGNDGEVASMVLPGEASANFAGESISHADGRPLQRVGIIPDIWAEPTLKGIQEGRDEILDAAINVLTRR